jgi:hypothetical protein
MPADQAADASRPAAYSYGDRGSAKGLPVDDAVQRGSAAPVGGAPPAGRAGRLGLVPVPSGGSQAGARPSRIVHGGHRHTIERAAALAARLVRPELAPWPEQLPGLLGQFAGRLE